MEFLRLDSRELTGDVRKRVNGDWLQWRLPLRGPDTLEGLREVSFKGLFRYGTVFGGVGIGDSRPGRQVTGMDGCKPRGLDRKACCSVEVADEGSNSGQVVVVQGRGSGAPLVGIYGCAWVRREKHQSLAPVSSRQPQRMTTLSWDNTVTAVFSNKKLLSWSQIFPIPIRL